MLRKFLRLFHTLHYIKGIQWQYQLWYRVKNRFISIHWYKKYLKRSFVALNVKVSSILYANQQEYLGGNRFELIGLKQSFGDSIDWNYQGHGKLWNFNLQYFAYLLDETISCEERLRILKDFSQQLLASNIQPEPYPVSLRIINSLLFYSRYPITDSIVLEALQKQIDYLDHNLEYHLLANHLLENAFSLFIASVYLSDLSLYERSYRLLETQLDEQILSDGGHYECSVMYHSILLSKLLLCIDVACQATFINVNSLTLLKEKAAKMLGWMNTYSFPDGSWALMNDAAENVAPSTQSLNEAATSLNIMPSKSPLKDSGFRKIKGANWELLIKTGGVQPTYQPGHVHADVSTYCLWYKGKQVLVDPGISTYAISERRNIERGTRAHNTVSINGLNQSDVWGGFRVGKRARVMCLDDTSHCVQIAVHPYFNHRCKHERKFVKISDFCLVIEDRIKAASFMTLVKGNIQFASNVAVDHRQELLKIDGLTIAIQGVEKGKLQNGNYAVCYHRLKSGIRYEYHASPISRFTFTFS
jgi:Heparinase II/III-like protein/Heparinase II/III N-terminus